MSGKVKDFWKVLEGTRRKRSNSDLFRACNTMLGIERGHGTINLNTDFGRAEARVAAYIAAYGSPKDIHTERAEREGITRMEAKSRNYIELFKMQEKRWIKHKEKMYF